MMHDDMSTRHYELFLNPIKEDTRSRAKKGDANCNWRKLNGKKNRRTEKRT
jgi:hypothetical protein